MAESVDGLFDHATSTIPVTHIIVIDDRIAAKALDLGDNFRCRCEVVSFARERSANIVDDNFCAFSSES